MVWPRAFKELSERRPRERLSSSLALIAGFVLVAALSLYSYSPPPPAGRDSADDEFSAERAGDMLARILDDGRPHPTGSAENAAVRDHVVTEFERLGYRAEVRRRFVCDRWDSCATVDNILAHLPGTGAERGVLLASHYDSVAVGPGAADAGAGVAAILEVARALRAGPALPRRVWFLIGDGEEIALLSAEAFVREPEFSAIGTVVNLEARGTSGPSQLFETQAGNSAIVSLAREALTRPIASSLAYEIYKHMPNDTDFTVFRREGLAGVNLGFIGDPARYHTPRDDLDHLDPGSLQHHGENALDMVRALAMADAEPLAEQDSVFLDMFGMTLVGWPVAWNSALLALGLIGWIALALRAARERKLRALRLLTACLLMTLLPVVAMLSALGLQSALAGTDAASSPWTAEGEMLASAFLLLAVAACALLARPAQRWAGEAALALAVLFPFALVAIATVALLPGASFMALLPLIAGVLCGHILLKRPAFWGGTAAVLTAMLWFPFAFLTYETVGYDGLSGVTLLMAFATLPLLPALAGLGRGAPLLVGASLAGLAALTAVALLRPAFTADVPRGINLVYTADRESGRLFVDTRADDMSPELMRAGSFESTAIESLPWSDRT
ncbi:MAG: M20/M25/M40 family metallo-hydrolase, partial [Woeseiaceae bacterium]